MQDKIFTVTYSPLFTMKPYYVTTGNGTCTVVMASSPENAKRKVLAEVGTMTGVTSVREATKEDIAWIRGMGGYVPPDALQLCGQ